MAKKTVHGNALVGDQFTQDGQLYRITKIISQVEKYELDGVIYSDEYPGEEPDMQWCETTFSYEAVSEEEVAAQRAQRNAEREAQEAQRNAEREAQEQKETRFQQFLERTGDEGEVWSGYDLPVELYPINREGNPINEYPSDYRKDWVGNGLGFWCADNAALERLFKYAYERDDDCTEERVNRLATKTVAGSEYYRWIVARKY